MKQFMAVVSVSGDRIAKYQDFDTQAEADSHVAEYGGFAVETPATGSMDFWVVDEIAKTITHDSAAEDADALNRKWAEVRSNRDRLLKDSDFTQLDDSPKNKLAWETYRTALRDITEQSDPDNITWPVAPND